MKLRNKLKLNINRIATLIVAIVTLASCGEDRWPEYAALTEKDQWIYDIMQENYLWSDEMPSSDNLNFFSAPSTFLQSILYKAEDNNYSTVDTVETDSSISYGFSYNLTLRATGDSIYYALVTRVTPDSPASEAGLERGNYIMLVDGDSITKSNSETLLDSGKEMKLTIGKYSTTTDEESNTVSQVTKSGTVEMAAARAVEEDVVGNYTVVTTPKGIKVGYLLYNKFKAGTDSDSEKYNNQLREASNYFAQYGISYLVVDLRYNSGGSFADSQLLASIIAPLNAINSGSTYATLTYNQKRSAENTTLTYSNSLIGSGTNLNIAQGIFLTGSQTSASVVGCFMNCLSTFECWALIGSSVTCWGVATERIYSEDLQWEINPVVCSVTNSNGETGAGGTFSPNVSVSETSDMSRYLPLGNPDEALLHAAIQLIDGD
jgi:hypothetical protein